VAANEHVSIGATRCYGDDAWFREITIRGITVLVPLDQEDQARHELVRALSAQQPEAVAVVEQMDALRRAVEVSDEYDATSATPRNLRVVTLRMDEAEAILTAQPQGAVSEVTAAMICYALGIPSADAIRIAYVDKDGETTFGRWRSLVPAAAERLNAALKERSA